MNFDDLGKEHKVMVVMRKTLTNIIKDTTPEPGMIHPLSEQTVQDIRMCLGLISAREKELMEDAGFENNSKPHYVDEPHKAEVVKFHKADK